MAFEIDPRLLRSSIELGGLGRSRVLLKNNAHYFWFLLVPEVETGVVDLDQLSPELYGEVCFAVRQLCGWIKEQFQPDKVNVAAIGNVVSQLHIHVVGRFHADVAWPGTVWACEETKLFSEEEIAVIRNRFAVWQAG